MPSLLPDRGLTTPGDEAAEKWKADACRGLLQSERLSESREDFMEQIIHEMVIAFDRLLYISSKQKVNRAGCRKILNEASKLDEMLRCHSSKFEFRQRLTADLKRPGRIVHQEDSETVRLVDMATSKTIKKDSDLVQGAGGRIGERLCIGRPQLSRFQGGVDKPIKLRELRVYVKLDHPMARKPRKRPAPTEEDERGSKALVRVQKWPPKQVGGQNTDTTGQLHQSLF